MFGKIFAFSLLMFLFLVFGVGAMNGAHGHGASQMRQWQSTYHRGQSRAEGSYDYGCGGYGYGQRSDSYAPDDYHRNNNYRDDFHHSDHDYRNDRYPY